ncbi:hypothetical protein Cus16_0016 [Curtobacterium sp. ER1/6]|nr:hypothetical protein Cus16_0016 [Curtobacterium sp. ER1/6]
MPWSRAGHDFAATGCGAVASGRSFLLQQAASPAPGGRRPRADGVLPGDLDEETTL